MIDGEGGECWHRMVRMATNECFYISSPFSSSVFVSMLELHVSVAWCLVLTMFGAACGSYLGDFSSQQTSGLCAEAIFPPIFASIHYTLNSGLLSTGAQTGVSALSSRKWFCHFRKRKGKKESCYVALLVPPMRKVDNCFKIYILRKL